MTLRELLASLAALLDRVGPEAEVTVYYDDGHGVSELDEVFRDKEDGIGIAADHGHRSAREMHEHPGDREQPETPT